MRIAQLVSNYHRIPSGGAGAICQVVDQLTGGLVERGHQVTLFGSGDSHTAARLEAVSAGAISDLNLPESVISHYLHALAAKCYEMSAEFDIIHSHFNIVSAFYAGLVATPTVQTVHQSLTPDMRPILEEFKHLNYVSFSLSQRQQMPELNWVANIYHGVNTEKYTFNNSPQDYFLFVGPLTEHSAPHLAIEAAAQAGAKLVIAGRSNPQDNYWHEILEPTINDQQVRYVGDVDNGDKVELLRNARAILFPAQWDEPFGLALVEAMSCGTPVIGFNRGSVPEIVQHGETGFVVEDTEQMAQAISVVGEIDRGACRARTERLFSLEKMITGYENVYARIVNS